jgi:hypothetical protein
MPRFQKSIIVDLLLAASMRMLGSCPVQRCACSVNSYGRRLLAFFDRFHLALCTGCAPYDVSAPLSLIYITGITDQAVAHPLVVLLLVHDLAY